MMQENPVFEGSVSFGRFASESLAWEKWSSFSHNRYMEEVSKYSTPGSVAQKKAYFEAHYKQIAAAKKAAALLEQENGVSSAADVPKEENKGELQSAAPPPSHEDEEKPDEVKACIAENAASFEVGQCGLGEVAQDLQDEMVEEGNEEKPDELETPIVENSASAEASESSLGGEIAQDQQEETVEEGNMPTTDNSLAEIPLLIEPVQEPEHVENYFDASHATDMQRRKAEQLEQLIPKECPASNPTSSLKEKKPKLSALRSSIRHMASKLIPSTPTRTIRDNCATPKGRSSTKDALEKKRSARTLHMSINSPPWCNSQTSASATMNRPSTIQEKPQVPEIACSSSQRSSFSLNAQKAKTSTLVPVNQPLNLPLATPPTENKRKGITLDLRTPTSRLSDKKWQSWSTDRSKSTTPVHNIRSPTVPVGFNFRSDERAAKRKEYHLKLEEKFNVEAQKLQLQAKTKGQAERKHNELSQRVGFKARPMPDFHLQAAQQMNQVKKIPAAIPISPNPGRKSSCAAVQELKYQPLPRPPVKSDLSKNQKEKIMRTGTCSFTSLRKERTRENTSPNIQS